MTKSPLFALLIVAMAGGCHPRAEERAVAPAAEVGPGAAVSAGVPAGVVRQASDRVVFHLHKFLLPVGVEVDTYVPTGTGEVEAKASFGFQDRGSQVTLAASFLLGTDGAPVDYAAWGRTSRSSSIDERVHVAADGSAAVHRVGAAPVRVRTDERAVISSGYAPVLAQDLMLRTWVARGRPPTMPRLPEGTVRVTTRAREVYALEGKSVTLEHVSVEGLVWGREDAWLDEAGRLVAVVTRDAEFDHFEAVRDGFTPLLGELVGRAGADGMAWLAEVGKTAQASAGAVALVGGDVIDATGKEPIRDAVVVVDGGKIVAVGPRASTQIPAGATTVDVAGRTILPGLWDMHGHVQQVEQGAAYLAAGVTTVRDLGNILEFVTGMRDSIDAGQGLGPRILISGIVDGDGASALGTVRIKTKEDIGPVLDRLKKAGALEVKLYSSVAPALVRPIAEAAHKRGLRVTGHVPEGMDVLAAVAAGYDGVNHVTFLFGPLFDKGEARTLTRDAFQRRLLEADFNKGALAKVIKTLAAKRTVVDDTLALYELFNHTPEEQARREPGLAKLPAELRGLFDGARPEDAERKGAVFKKYVEMVGALHRAGVPVVAGTDIAVPGHSLHRELELYVEAGFTPMEAIQAATLVPARAMRLEKESGTIEVGKRADLVIVGGDPLADIRNVRRVERVVVRGKVYEPAGLWRVAGFVP